MAAPIAELITLPNGVRIGLDPMPGLKSVAMGVWLQLGSRDERPAEAGFAHLLEHMAFKGAAGRDARGIAEAFEGVGAQPNAATGFERTGYYARALSETAQPVFDLLCDLALSPDLDHDELQKEIGVVLEEMAEANDQPDDLVFTLLQAKAFPAQPLGRPILGTKAKVSAATSEGLRAFRQTALCGSRIVVVFAGGFDRAKVLDWAAARLQHLPNEIAPLRRVPASPKGGVVVRAKSAEQTHFAGLLAGPKSGDGMDVSAAQVLAEILGGGMSSRLFQEIREKRGLAYTVDAYYTGYEDVGRMGVYAACAPKNAALCAEICVSELLDLAQNGPKPDELARAKTALRAQVVMGAESSLARAEGQAATIFARNAPMDLADRDHRLAQINATMVQAAAARACHTGGAAAAVVGPKLGHAAASLFCDAFLK